MQYPQTDLAHVCTIGPYNSTKPVASYRVDEVTTLIGIEDVAMFGGGWTLRGLPSPLEPAVDDTRVRPDVVASLERSLREHADVWAELSRY